MESKNSVLELWDERATLLESAGTNDLIAKQLEITELTSHVRDGMKVLEIGCGNGITAIEIAKRFAVTIQAFDFSESMIEAAKKLAGGEQFKGSVDFRVGDVRHMPELKNQFDLVITERVLINLPDWETQARAIQEISGYLAPGGRYLMCENSQDGLDQINDLREQAGLKRISPPWHNCYFREEKINSLRIPEMLLAEVRCYSSTYYFLSRLVNAWLAHQEGREPAYDAAINQLALLLPPIAQFGQGKLWIWEKSFSQ
ncbi:MAG: class I SAM-dependent methyltransferase [Burkholderiales bacterium]